MYVDIFWVYTSSVYDVSSTLKTLSEGTLLLETQRYLAAKVDKSYIDNYYPTILVDQFYLPKSPSSPTLAFLLSNLRVLIQPHLQVFL